MNLITYEVGYPVIAPDLDQPTETMVDGETVRGTVEASTYAIGVTLPTPHGEVYSGLSIGNPESGGRDVVLARSGGLTDRGRRVALNTLEQLHGDYRMLATDAEHIVPLCRLASRLTERQVRPGELSEDEADRFQQLLNAAATHRQADLAEIEAGRAGRDDGDLPWQVNLAIEVCTGRWYGRPRTLKQVAGLLQQMGLLEG